TAGSISAHSAEALMRFAAVLGVIASQYPDPNDLNATPEAHVRTLNKKIRISAAAGNARNATTLVTVEVDQADPLRAQKISAAVIDKLLEAAQPGPLKKARLEAQLERAEEQQKSILTLIERLESETPKLVAQMTLHGELATPLSGLYQQ